MIEKYEPQHLIYTMPSSNTHLGDKDCASRSEDRREVQQRVTPLDALTHHPKLQGAGGLTAHREIVEEMRLPIGLSSLKGVLSLEMVEPDIYPLCVFRSGRIAQLGQSIWLLTGLLVVET